MTAQLLSGYLTPATATASSAAANYPATAALTPVILRGWRSASGGAQWLQVDLGAAVTIAGMALQAIDYSAGGSGIGLSVSVTADNSSTPTTSRGTLPHAVDANARRKGSLVPAAFSARYVRFSFSGANAGGWYGIGAVYVFATAAPTAVDPLYGGSSITLLDPQVRADLANGVSEVYAAGPSLAELDLGFAARPASDIEAIRRAARAAPCWFDFGLSAQRDRQWPVRHLEAQTVRKITRYNREDVSLKLREIV